MVDKIKDISERISSSNEVIFKELRSFAELVESIESSEKEKPQAFIVGGFIRDSLLGLDPKDIDIEVYGIEADSLEKIIAEKYTDPVESVGKIFTVTKIKITSEIEFDINIINKSMDLKEASARRDFSFNSLSINIVTGEFFDFYGGVIDLENRILRCTDYVRFQDDPLRVYRAVQFVARMNLAIEEKTHALLSEMVANNTLDNLPKERITVEFEKLLLKAEKPSVGFELAYKLGIIKKYFPELNILKEIQQDKVWHPEGDVWIHTMMVVNEAARIIRREHENFSKNEKLIIMLGALCHDLGKAVTTEEIDGKIKSHAHDSAGEPIVMEFMNQFTFSDSVTEGVLFVTTMHMIPGNLYRAFIKGDLSDKNYINAVRRLLRKIHPLSWKVFIACSEADSRGRLIDGVSENPYKPGDLFSKTIKENKLDEQLDPLVMGRDLIILAQELNVDLQPGKKFGQYIKQIEDLRDAGEISTKEEALIIMKDMLKKDF